MNIATVLDRPASEDPTRVALILREGPITYGQLADAALMVGWRLRREATTAGDRVAVVDVGSVLSIASMLGIARIGGAAALMNPALQTEEITALLETASCTGVVVAGHASRSKVPPNVQWLGPDDLLTSGEATSFDPQGGDDDDGLILFTSGTTGLPKAVAISHGVLSRRITGFTAPFDRATKPTVGMMCVPFFHVGGSLGLLGALYSGNTTVVQERFDAGEWLRLVDRYHVASTFLVPTMLQRILDHPDFARASLRSLVAIAYGAAAAPVELVQRAMEAMPHVAFANVFGQTETLGAYTTLLPEDHRRPDRIGSVGKALPGTEIRIVRPGTDDPVSAGEVGELVVLSEQNVTPGWLRTGDLARMDAEGYVYPAGRLSDTINRGGEKFGPIEIETVLRQHPAIAEVAVVGVPDPEMGERVGAVVVAKQEVDDEELRQFCALHLARFKLPERIAFVSEIPHSETGKVNRRAVTELLGQSTHSTHSS